LAPRRRLRGRRRARSGRAVVGQPAGARRRALRADARAPRRRRADPAASPRDGRGAARGGQARERAGRRDQRALPAGRRAGWTVGRAVEPGAERRQRRGPLSHAAGAARAREHRPPVRAHRRHAGGRVARAAGAAVVERRCRARVGTCGDRVGLRGRLRAYLSGPRPAADVADLRDDRRADHDARGAGAVNLDDAAAIERIDRHDTRGVLADFPAQCRRGCALPAPSGGPRPRLVVVAGMGGSASGGDMVAACAADTLDVPIFVHRGYGLPAAAGRDALVVAMSYSGETAEVLSAAEAALARGASLVTITAGGTLGTLGAGRGLPGVTLPGGLMPRMALGYLVFPLLSVLAGRGATVASAQEIEEALDVVAAQAEDLGPASPLDKNA